MTHFSKQCEILSQLWMDYRHDEDFEDFIEYNDLGLPLAHFIHEDIVKPTPQAELYVGETFNLFIAALEADPEEDYETLEDLLMRYGK
jgi:hypothetical protein